MNESKKDNTCIEEETYKNCIELGNKLGLNDKDSISVMLKVSNLLIAKGINNNHNEIIGILPEIYFFIKMIVSQQKQVQP